MKPNLQCATVYNGSMATVSSLSDGGGCLRRCGETISKVFISSTIIQRPTPNTRAHTNMKSYWQDVCSWESFTATLQTHLLTKTPTQAHKAVMLIQGSTSHVWLKPHYQRPLLIWVLGGSHSDTTRWNFTQCGSNTNQVCSAHYYKDN